jgi:hypothetical protein
MERRAGMRVGDVAVELPAVTFADALPLEHCAKALDELGVA